MTLIDFPKPKEAWTKPKTLEDWPWDKDMGKPYGDINGAYSPDFGHTETIDNLITEREKTHGPYKVKAKIIQDLKAAMETTEGWDNLNDMQRESLHMIAHKIGRILSGNPNCADHWDDVAGYARLVSKSL